VKALRSDLAKALLADPATRNVLRQKVPTSGNLVIEIRTKDGQVKRYKAVPVPKAA